MFELKVIKVANSIYRGVIRLGLRSVNARDVRALRKMDSDTERAKGIRKVATNLHLEANALEDNAQLDYAIKQRKVNSAYNVLSNALDDAQVTF